MALTKATLAKVAHLARLHVSPAEAAEVTRRITDTLALIDQMKEVDTDGVEPLAHPLDMTQRLRPDEVSEAGGDAEAGAEVIAQRERLQAAAPATEGGLYLVPKVMGDE